MRVSKLICVPICVASLASLLGACGAKDSSGGTTFVAPSLSGIVEAAVPSSLKTSTLAAFFKKPDLHLRSNANPIFSPFVADCSSVNGGTTTGCSTPAKYIGFLQAEVFTDIEGVAEPQFYRYWVNVVDAAMTETNTRLAGNADETCLTSTAATVNFTFNINATDVTVAQKLQCWENQTGPAGSAATQNFAFGKDEDNFYLVYRTNDNEETSGKGSRILLAKASADGNKAEIWFIGKSMQNDSGTLVNSVNAQRILANKATGEFTFNTVEDPDLADTMLFSSFFGNTDGTNAYFEARFGNSTLTDVTSMVPGTGWCSTTAALTTAGGDCSALDSDSMPTAFGLSAPMKNGAGTQWQADDTAEAAFITAITAIEAIDYEAQEVQEMAGAAAAN